MNDSSNPGQGHADDGPPHGHFVIVRATSPDRNWPVHRLYTSQEAANRRVERYKARGWSARMWLIHIDARGEIEPGEAA